MQRRRFFIKTAVAAVTVAALVGCSATYRSHGYVPQDEDLDFVIVGVDTKDTVIDSIGPPSASGLLENSGWYYVGSRWRHFAWQAPREIEREVVAISFDAEGVVENIERFGLEDGRVVVLSRRVTDSNIKGVGFLKQLFGNIGGFTAEQILGGN